jgi:hypothetical protein
MEKLKEVLKATYLCIKYPFLYPRNRFTDLHYTNWTLHEYLKKLYDKAYILDKRSYLVKTKNVFYVVWYRIIDFIYKWICPIFHCIPTYTEWDAMPEGWRKAFGDDMLNELNTIYKKFNRVQKKHFRILQIKEKYGSLRFYTSFTTPELAGLIIKYEALSKQTCIECGYPATHMTKGYILPLCDECDKK